MTDEETFKRILADEGFKKEFYLDTHGNLTIGPGLVAKEGYSMPVSAINEWASWKYQICIKDYRRFCRAYCLDLDSVRRSVIVEMIWNIGFRGVTRFRRMVADMQRGDWSGAGMEILDSALHRELASIRGDRDFQVRTEIWAEMMEHGSLETDATG